MSRQPYASTTGNLPPDGGVTFLSPMPFWRSLKLATTPRIVPPRCHAYRLEPVQPLRIHRNIVIQPSDEPTRFGHGRGVEGPPSILILHQHRLETHGQQSSAAQRSGAEQYAMKSCGYTGYAYPSSTKPAMFQTQPTAYKNPLFARWIDNKVNFLDNPIPLTLLKREQPRETGPRAAFFIKGNPMYGTANRDLPTNDGAAYQKALPSVPEVLRNLNREEQPNPWGALDTRYLPDPTRSTRSDLKRKRNLSNNGESDKRLSERELFRHNLESHRRLNNTIQPRQDNRMPFLNAPFAPHPVAGNPGSIAFLNPQENEYPVPWNFRQDADNSALDYDERPRYHNRAPSGNPRPRRRARRQDPSSNEALHDFPNDQQHQSLGTESVANINPKIDHQIAQNIAAMDRRLDNVFGQPAQNSSADTFTEPARARPYWTIFDDVAEARRRDQRIRDNLKRFEDDYGSPGPPPSACGSDGHFESRQPLPVREVHRPPPRLPHMRLPSLSPNSRSHVIPATTASLPLG
ncbi:hypothetical protein BZA77DRAFT_295193 [Pyronema omphalodes]|nr:hypothetical protein BZA77DRAFT_295193 [Pyronema omphalodes]